MAGAESEQTLPMGRSGEQGDANQRKKGGEVMLDGAEKLGRLREQI